MHGQRVCHAHGGKSPQALAAAKVRIAKAAQLRVMERTADKILRDRAKQAKWASKILGRPEEEIDSKAIAHALSVEAFEAAARSFEKPHEKS